MAADPKKPYGDVTYADPGYQADGKKRYPLMDEAHCRNAWSRINDPDNAAKYSADQLASIKSRIKAAGKKYGIEFSDARADEIEDSEYRRVMPDTQTRAFDLEIRSTTGDGRTLEGYVAVFGSVARIADTRGAFDEEIHRGAFDRSLRGGFPVMQFEHGRDTRVGMLPIGVYERFEPDKHGYFVRGRLLDDPLVEPIRKAIDMKAIRGMSWRMRVPDAGEKWTRAAYRSAGDGRADKRDIFDADVPEAGPVVFPAYDTTTVSVRSLLSTFGAEERAALIRELAAEVGAAIDLTVFAGQPAQGAGGGEHDAVAQERSASPETPAPNAPQPHLRQRLDAGALRIRGILP